MSAAAAESLARAAHSGQVDKQGRDYATHHLAPVAALLAPFGAEAVAAGWLHDIIEDTDTTFADLRMAGFSAWVVNAVDSVTRREGESYTGMLYRAADDPGGRLVKLMDNWVNLNGLDDLAVVDAVKAASLRKRYLASRVVLLAAVTRP